MTDTAAAPATTPTPTPATETPPPATGEAKTPDPAAKPVEGQPTGEQKAAQAASKWVQKLKIDGAEEELNLEDEGTLKKVLQAYSKSKGADKRFQEANLLRQQAQAETEKMKQLAAALKTKPAEVLKALGVDFDRLAEERLMARIEREKMPVEKRLELEYQEKLALLEQKATRSEQLAQQAQLERETAIQQQRLEAEIMGALEAAPLLPKSPMSVKRIAFNLEQAMKHGVDMTVQEAAKMAEMEYEGDADGYLRSAKAERLYEKLGPAVVAELIKLHTAKGGQTPPALPQPPPNGTQNGGNGVQPRKKIGMEAYFESLERKFPSVG